MKKKLFLLSLISLFFACCGDDNSQDANQDLSSEKDSSEQEKLSSSDKKTSESGESTSSSSKKTSSSSKNTSSPKKTTVDPASVVKGSLTDKRDGHVYATVTIGEQTWMAENLNYETESGSSCYDSNDKDCEKYGRIYQYGAILDTTSNGYSLRWTNDPYVQGICPDGWRIPTYNDWNTLATSIGKGYIEEKLYSTNFLVRKDEYATDIYGFSITTELNHWTSSISAQWADSKPLSVSIEHSLIASNETIHIETLSPSEERQLRCIKGFAPTPWPDLNSPSSVKSNAPDCQDSIWNPKVKPCNVNGVDSCKYGELANKRIIKIGNQEWAETTVNIQSYTKYHCPFGWHTPTSQEWEELIDNIGGRCFAGIMLKTKTGRHYRNGMDAYGFSISANSLDGPLYLPDSLDAAYFKLEYPFFDNEYTPKREQTYCVKSHPAPDISDSLLNPNFNYGEFTDSRDGKTYKTTIIGPQKWMSENLNYETKSSFCYRDHFYSDYCDSYGRYYSFEDALTACPEGWHLPSKDEFDTLIYFGSKNNRSSQLSSIYHKGKDSIGLTLTMVGYARNDSSFLSEYNILEESYSASASIWSSTPKTDSVAYCTHAYFYSPNTIRTDTIVVGTSYKHYHHPIRCVNDTAIVYSYDGEYGTLADERDGQEYKTVEINGLTWMAENLRYKTPDSTRSYCYQDSCVKYGRYYSYPFTTDSTEALCPTGWHISTGADWENLLEFAGPTANEDLRSVYGWEYRTTEHAIHEYSFYHGVDKYGFGIVPNGVITNPYVFESPNAVKINQDGYRRAILAVDEPNDSLNYYLINQTPEIGIRKKTIERNSLKPYPGIRCVKD